MIETERGSEESINEQGNLAPETLRARLGLLGREKDKLLGALHNRIANWGAGFLDYHLGFVWDGFGRYAERQRGKARAHFRNYLEQTSSEENSLQPRH